MPQFIVRPEDLDLPAGAAWVRGSEAKHLRGVLRARPGDPVELTDGQGRRWQGVVAATGGDGVRLEELLELPGNEPNVRLELLQALPKGDRWEEILEKGTELGAGSFRPVYSDHSVPRLPAGKLARKLERWTDKLRAAVKQCERARVPEVHPPQELSAFLQGLASMEKEARFYLAERSGAEGFPRQPAAVPSILLAVGPEGGWSSAEARQLETAGFRAVSLGPRILRCETAAVAGMALALHAWRDLV